MEWKKEVGREVKRQGKNRASPLVTLLTAFPDSPSLRTHSRARGAVARCGRRQWSRPHPCFREKW